MSRSCAAFAIAILATTPAFAAGTLRIGWVIPSRTGEQPTHTASVNDYPGDGALMGARLAEAIIGEVSAKIGLELDLRFASSPSLDAARRAAERLIEVDQVDALVGGIGEGQAAALSEIATRAGIPFFNIGSTDDALRGPACSRFAFHIEASDAMYIEALAESAIRQDWTDWFVVRESGPAGDALLARAEAAAAGVGANVVGSVAVPKKAPTYFQEIRSAEASGADVILVLLDPWDQMIFIEQQDSVRLDLPTLTLPATLTQTRDYISAARFEAPAANPRHRVALWETTLTSNGAEAFNEAFRARWASPADPTAWAAYAAVQILVDAAEATGATDPAALIGWLEDPATEIDVMKGPGLSFRSWDHQLRQPLYDIAIDEDVEWERMRLQSWIDLAGDAKPIPGELGSDVRAALDGLGDSEDEGLCEFR